MPTAVERELVARVTRLLIELVGMPSVSGSEDAVRAYVAQKLESLGLTCSADRAGNLIGTLAGAGEPLLLNAHLDRVPPGLGHTPRVARGRMYSDGTTNLGADDGAGIAVVLLALDLVVRERLAHPPLVALFTVGEEVGLRGAAAFDPAPWHVERGIVFDNAGAAGEVVTRASTYVAFDVTLGGTGGHPGKTLDGTLSAIELFRAVDLPLGRWPDGQTRVSIGTISGGAARNAIPSEVRLSGEVRSLASGEHLEAALATVERAFVAAAARLGGAATCTFESHGRGYAIPADEPLLRAWRDAWRICGHADAQGIVSYIGSDTNALRERLRVFTVSTGVEDEHSVRESVALAPLAELALAARTLITQLTGSPVPPGH